MVLKICAKLTAIPCTSPFGLDPALDAALPPRLLWSPDTAVASSSSVCQPKKLFIRKIISKTSYCIWTHLVTQILDNKTTVG